MRDWKALAEQRLASLALEPEEKAEVIAEVAAHLEEICEEMLKQGLTEEEAVRRALSKVGNWRDLQRKIFAAKRREQPMKKRVWQLWVPGFLTLILSMLFLTVLYRLGLRASLVSSGPNAILLYTPWLAGLPFFGALGGLPFVSGRRFARHRGSCERLSGAGAYLCVPVHVSVQLDGRTNSGKTGRL
jgi:hypothetical protein